MDNLRSIYSPEQERETKSELRGYQKPSGSFIQNETEKYENQLDKLEAKIKVDKASSKISPKNATMAMRNMKKPQIQIPNANGRSKVESSLERVERAQISPRVQAISNSKEKSQESPMQIKFKNSSNKLKSLLDSDKDPQMQSTSHTQRETSKSSLHSQSIHREAMTSRAYTPDEEKEAKVNRVSSGMSVNIHPMGRYNQLSNLMNNKKKEQSSVSKSKVRNNVSFEGKHSNRASDNASTEPSEDIDALQNMSKEEMVVAFANWYEDFRSQMLGILHNFDRNMKEISITNGNSSLQTRHNISHPNARRDEQRNVDDEDAEEIMHNGIGLTSNNINDHQFNLLKNSYN